MGRRGPRLRLSKVSVAAVLGAGMAAFGALPAFAQSATTTVVPSANWAGYAATGPAGSFSSVAASWTQPTVSCAVGETSYSSYWVGLDGYNSRTVEQIGTDSDCINGTATYYAWYEIYPKPATVIPAVSVSASTAITASVDYEPATRGPGTFTVALSTAGGDFSLSAKSPAARRTSAEVIVEAPSRNHGPFGSLPLSEFGSVTFSGATVNATVPLGAAPTLAELVMQSSGATVALPSDFTSAGSSFAVTREPV